MRQTQTVNIIVAGPSGAGKTTLIQTAGQHGIEGLTKWERIGYEKQLRRASPEEKERMVRGYENFGRISVDDNTRLHLHGAPSAQVEGHLVMWEILTEGALGYLIMVDSTQLASLPEARYTIDTVRSYAPIPYIVAANKQDLPNAANVEMLRSELGLEEAVPIVPCVATDQQSARATIYVLLRRILEDMEDDWKAQ